MVSYPQLIFMPRKIEYIDDDKAPLKRLLTLRIPSLLCGLVLGLVLSIITSKFETVLASNIALAFFIPFIVYLADAVGTQTQTIYVRDLKTGKADFKKYLFKESLLGVVLGSGFAAVTWAIVAYWFNSIPLACAIALSVFGAVGTAPLIALVIAEILELEREDPAVWSGPLATVVQDVVSMVIFGGVASAILL